MKRGTKTTEVDPGMVSGRQGLKTQVDPKEQLQIHNPYCRCSLYGAALVAAEVYDPDFCVHGPQGCASAIIEGFIAQGKELEFHHSIMSQHDIIYGGENTLFQNVKETFSPYEKAGPKYVFTSCSSEIIGDNVDAVCSRFNEELPLVKVSSCGMSGDLYAGMEETLKGLVSKFAKNNPEKNPRMVNLVGAIGLSRQWRGDFYETVRLLSELGIEVNSLACDSTLDNLAKSSSAALTVLLIPEVGFKAAEYLTDKFGIPSLYSPLFLPLGLRGTEVWLKKIGRALEIPQKRIRNLVAKEEDIVRGALKVGLLDVVYAEKLSILRGLPVAILAEGSVAFSWARFAREELEMTPVFLGMRTGADQVDLARAIEEWKKDTGTGVSILFQPTTRQTERELSDTGTRFIMGSSIEADLGEKLGIENFLHITNPNTHYVNINSVPFLGYRGLLSVTETILNQIRH